MAQYDESETLRIYQEKVDSLRKDFRKVDLTMLDMIGFYVWSRITDGERPMTNRQDALFGGLLAAFAAGREMERGGELATEFLGFIDGLELADDGIKTLEELMNW
jgi:hypothetical protein